MTNVPGLPYGESEHPTQHDDAPTPTRPEEGNRTMTETIAPATAEAPEAAEAQGEVQAQPTAQPTAPAVTVTATPVPVHVPITEDIRLRCNQIVLEMRNTLQERDELLYYLMVARIAQEHVLMVGPGGTGKSLLARLFRSHINSSVPFEVAVDETSDPAQVFGPPDIKAMVEEGKTRRVVTGMLPEATDAFIDEFFNANGPLLHSIMPILNERVFHNNGMPSEAPLRQVIAGTNKLNSDADQAALWDRIHLRFVVDYIADRDSQILMVGDAIARMAANGRGLSTSIAGTQRTTVSLDELDVAHNEALMLEVPDNVLDTMFDIRDELQGGSAKITISDRRAVEGLAAVMANAWLRGHAQVQVSDLDVLAHMWWTLLDQAPVARNIILASTNPSEKAALDLLEALQGLEKEVKDANDSDMDETRKKRAGVEAVKNADKLVDEAKEKLVLARAAGVSTIRLEECIAKAEAFKQKVGASIFGLNPNEMKNVAAAAGN